MMPHAKSPKKFNWRAWVMRLCVMNVSRIQRVTLEKSKKVTSWRPDHQKQKLSNKILPSLVRGAAIAQWIHLQLPSCHPGSSPNHIIYAFIIYCQICAIFVM